MPLDGRLVRLRALVAAIERLPESGEREWMLREARSRLVDVETGYRPQGLRPPVRQPPPAPAPVANGRLPAARSSG